MNEKLILTDIDGVFLRWDTAFTKWMSSKKFKVAVPDVYSQAVRYNITKDKQIN